MKQSRKILYDFLTTTHYSISEKIVWAKRVCLSLWNDSYKTILCYLGWPSHKGGLIMFSSSINSHEGVPVEERDGEERKIKKGITPPQEAGFVELNTGVG